MKLINRTLLLRSLLAVPCFAAALTAAEPYRANYPVQLQHPAVGSWFGKADQICASASGCLNLTLFMTPTLTDDREFIANDSNAFGGPPFGPHTTAHGRWIPTSNDSIIADYTFMLPGTTTPPTVTALRFRWKATVIDYNTMQGYVNIYFGPNLPLVWQNLTANQFPVLPNEAAPVITAPTAFFTDPAACASGPPACPLMFKFTVKRVQP